MVAARMMVGSYFLLHGKLKLRGAGWLIRKSMKLIPSLRAYPQPVPGAGTAVLDLSDAASYDVLNAVMGDPGPNRHLFPWIERLLWPGQVVWDIGANVGYFSLHLSRLVPALKAIHAFEPNPKALETLATMFGRHHLVKVHEVGLAAKDEVLQMQCPSDATPYGTLARDLPGAERFPVRLRNGDDYCAQNGLDLPDMIKIDVEGFEPEVFAGLKETIREARPIILFEHCWLEDNRLDEILSCMPPGYSLLFMIKGGGASFDRAQRRDGDDAVLFPVEKEPLVASCRAELAGGLPDEKKTSTARG